MNRDIRISEIFGPTIQGEGPIIGHPTVFVRTGGCDYRCRWWDTLYAVLPEYRDEWTLMTPAEILARVADADSFNATLPPRTTTAFIGLAMIRFMLRRSQVRRGASLYATRQGGQNVATLQLAADDDLASGVNSANLEHRLGDVETDCLDPLHG